MALKRGMATFLAGVVVLGGAACVSTGIDSYEDFRGAVDSGATCAQLVDMRPNFDDRPRVQEKVDADLEELGCRAGAPTGSQE